MQALAEVVEAPFAASREHFECLLGYLRSEEAMAMRVSGLEREMEERGRELMRRLLQDHLDVRGPGQAQGPVRAADGATRTRQRLQERNPESLFGTVEVRRTGYGAEGAHSLHPLDAELNLPPQLYSHEVERRVAEEVARAAFDETVCSVGKNTGAAVPKRQVEELARRAAQDFDAFYGQRLAQAEPPAAGAELVVTTLDGKGVVMRRADLREATRKAAERRVHKLSKRLSKGEKHHAKRMATVAAVYTVAPVVRSAEEVMRGLTGVGPVQDAAAPKPPRPRPRDKRVWASLEKDPQEVVTEVFEEAMRRDPQRQQRWVTLVDGDPTQLRRLRQHIGRLGLAVTIVLDIVHVAQYLWAAALAFCVEGSRERELWVAERLVEILRGRAGWVAGGMRRSATLRGLSSKQREAVDKCARYLLRYKAYLRYDQYLAAGLPIATGVIEGACRYLVKDRMDITGARWSLAGAEAVLRLRAVRASGDFDAYWGFHEDQEYQRHHVARYADGKVPAVEKPIRARPRPQRNLRVVK